METLFRVLVRNSSDAIVMLNEDGSIRFASESSARLLGYTLEERIGRSAFEMMHPDDMASARAGYVECLQRPGVPFPAEYRQGTGLGLSIVYGIAKEAGGTVSFFTAPNEGTTFEVLLPLVSNI